MINYIYSDENGYHFSSSSNSLQELSGKEILCIDLESPSFEEKSIVEEYFDITFLSWHKAEEIESSSRYFESGDVIRANSNFMRVVDGKFGYTPVSFILKNDILFAYHSEKTNGFYQVYERLVGQPSMEVTGWYVFLTLLDVRIDFDADLIEFVGREINAISQRIRFKQELEERLILEIAKLQEASMLLRENIVDKQRVMSSILKSRRFPEDDKLQLRMMLKDAGSLIDHTAFSFERLDFLQSTLMGLIDLEQNKIIKIFTVVTVIFSPPTLIASMYGMNFKFMPELSWEFGYPLCIFLMVTSSLLTLLYFKRKNWL